MAYSKEVVERFENVLKTLKNIQLEDMTPTLRMLQQEWLALHHVEMS